MTVKRAVHSRVPGPARELIRLALHASERRAVTRFVANGPARVSRGERLALVRRYLATSARITCAHTQEEMLSFVQHVLDLPAGVPGVVVEAGCYKGGSTAKISLACRAAGRRLVVFDSFQGIPPNDENHGVNLFGQLTPFFRAGEYRGALDEVRANVDRFGALSACEFVPGWFDDTLPGFGEPVAAAFIDVDLASSTRTCLRHLYPRLVPGGALFSHDGHLPLVRRVMADARFWEEEVGVPPPVVEGLGWRKLVVIHKPGPAG